MGRPCRDPKSRAIIVRSLPKDGVPSRGRHIPTTFQGRYEDRLRRVDGQWRIARRRILTDWIAPAVAAGVAESP